MILPVTINGHLPIVVYLENIFAKNWYVEERVKWVRMAANQGAIILENARTHEQSIKLNDEIRKEMAEKEHLTSVLEAQKDAHMKALVLTQDNERKRIASDLHDSLGSLLSSVRLRFNGLQETFTKNVPEKAVKFNDTLSLLDDSIQELRKIAHNMLPVSLSRFGLKSALHTFIQHINLSEQLDVDLQMLGLEERLPESIEVVVYRICQELVQNVIKHARASRMQIQIIHHHDSLNIIVADNGKGMDTKHITPGFGFETIRSKVALYNGTFEIDSQPERGSMVLVDLIIKDTDSKLP
jgi:signal transduction histidine kinase